jgi:hypothetical protein
MTFKPAIWHPIASVLCVVNLVGVGLAAREAHPWHAALHAVLGLAFGVWAQRLGRGPRRSEPQTRLAALEAEVGMLRQDLRETEERLKVAERLLAQRPDTRRLDS